MNHRALLLQCCSGVLLLSLSSLVQAQVSSCLSYLSCSSCTAQSGCGWANGLACYPGTSPGASYPYTSNLSWTWSSSGCSSSSSGSSCLSYSSCFSCTSQSGCGWANAFYCYPGNSFGASSPYSSASSWKWGTSDCCPSTNHCTTCIAMSNCGWDGSTCRYGTSSGPSNGTVNGTWSYSSCNCSSNTDCVSCASEAGCGWANGDACYPGTSAGAISPYSSPQSWAWTPNACNPRNMTCSDYSTCSSCIAQVECGWANGVACYPGTSAGASSPFSSNISWNWARCPPFRSCQQYASCSRCIREMGCGWYDGTVCVPGTAAGPLASASSSSNSSTGNWSWSSCPPWDPEPNCLNLTDCTSCLNVGCGWANGAACYPGNYSGAAPPYSSNLSWSWLSCPDSNGGSGIGAPCGSTTTCNNCVSNPFCGWDGLQCRSRETSGGIENSPTPTWYLSCPGSNNLAPTSPESWEFFAPTSYGLWLVVVSILLLSALAASCFRYRRLRPAVGVVILPIDEPLIGLGLDGTRVNCQPAESPSYPSSIPACSPSP